MAARYSISTLASHGYFTTCLLNSQQFHEDYQFQYNFNGEYYRGHS